MEAGIMQATLTFLGTGTSMGVPTLGCFCPVCTSKHRYDRRLRPSVALRWMQHGHGHEPQERIVVIDTGPDFREQAIQNNIHHVDAVLYTHAHADHILGMDDLRPLSFTAAKRGGPIPLFADENTAEVLNRIFDYTFSPTATYINRARVELVPLEASNTVHGVEFLRVPLDHGGMEIAGFRFGNAAYRFLVGKVVHALIDDSNVRAYLPARVGREVQQSQRRRHKPVGAPASNVRKNNVQCAHSHL